MAVDTGCNVAPADQAPPIPSNILNPVEVDDVWLIIAEHFHLCEIFKQPNTRRPLVSAGERLLLDGFDCHDLFPSTAQGPTFKYCAAARQQCRSEPKYP